LYRVAEINEAHLLGTLNERCEAAFREEDRGGADELLPIVYDQLRRLARRRLAQEAPGQLLQTADLVHEAYVRLVGSDPANGQRIAVGTETGFVGIYGAITGEETLRFDALARATCSKRRL
jgi:hypothetical protein